MPQSWEIENFLTVDDGRLHLDGVDTVALAREHGTPLFVFSESRIRHNIERIKKAASAIEHPLKLCYAAKAMSTMGIRLRFSLIADRSAFGFTASMHLSSINHTAASLERHCTSWSTASR